MYLESVSLLEELSIVVLVSIDFQMPSLLNKSIDALLYANGMMTLTWFSGTAFISSRSFARWLVSSSNRPASSEPSLSGTTK